MMSVTLYCSPPSIIQKRQTGQICRAVSPAFVEWNNAMYRYAHNLQGDIVGIVDLNGANVVEYRYDVHGVMTCHHWFAGSDAE